jgi:resolvase-like protein
VVVLVARRQVLVAYNRQVRQLPGDLQRCECGLIEIGRTHARDFDAGHAPSGSGVRRVLTELRKLAEHMASPAAEAATPMRSELDDIVISRHSEGDHDLRRSRLSRTRSGKQRRKTWREPYCRHMLIGYGRVSTAEQNPAHQVDALRRAGVAPEDVYIDIASEAKSSRPKLDVVLKVVRGNNNGNVGYQNCPNAGPAHRAACIAFWRPHGS